MSHQPLTSGGGGGLGAHASSHQNGGSDEINIAGLDGVSVQDAAETAARIAGDAATLASADAYTDASFAAHIAAADPHVQYQKESEKDAPSGYAGLNAASKLIAALATVLTFGAHLQSGGSSFDNSANVTITSDATAAATASTIVLRDGSGGTALGGTLTAQAATFTTVQASGLVTANGGLTIASGQTLTLTGATVAGAPTWSSGQTLPSLIVTGTSYFDGADAASAILTGRVNINIGPRAIRAAAAPVLNMTRMNTSFAAPSDIANADVLGLVQWVGYQGTGFVQSATMVGTATENWNASSRGTKLHFTVTANGTTGVQTALTLEQDRSATFATSILVATNITQSAGTAALQTVTATTVNASASITAGTSLAAAGNDEILWTGRTRLTAPADGSLAIKTSGGTATATFSQASGLVMNALPLSGITNIGLTGTIAMGDTQKIFWNADSSKYLSYTESGTIWNLAGGHLVLGAGKNLTVPGNIGSTGTQFSLVNSTGVTLAIEGGAAGGAAARISLQQAGANKWAISYNYASTGVLEFYEAAGGGMAMTIADSTKALRVYGAATFDTNITQSAGTLAAQAVTGTTANFSSTGTFGGLVDIASNSGWKVRNGASDGVQLLQYNPNSWRFNGLTAGSTIQWTNITTMDFDSADLANIDTATAASFVGPLTGNVTGNAATATILQNTRTLWGQNFNGSANVDGTITMGSGALNHASEFDINSGGANAVRINRSGGSGGFQVYEGGTATLNFSLANTGAATFRTNITQTAGTAALQAVTATTYVGSSTITAGGTVQVPNLVWYKGLDAGGSARSLIRSAGMGYNQTSYPGVQIGETGNHIALFIDPTSNSSGAFAGNTNELVLPNIVSVIQSNAGVTDWAQTMLLTQGRVTVPSLVVGTDFAPSAGNLGWNETGVRSWQLGYAASSGNLTVSSGDAAGTMRHQVQTTFAENMALDSGKKFNFDTQGGDTYEYEQAANVLEKSIGGVLKRTARGTATQVNATTGQPCSLTTPTDSVGVVWLNIVGRRTSNGERWARLVFVNFKNVGGTVTVGTPSVAHNDGDVGMSSVTSFVDASGADIRANVTGGGGFTTDFAAELEMLFRT